MTQALFTLCRVDLNELRHHVSTTVESGGKSNHLESITPAAMQDRYDDVLEHGLSANAKLRQRLCTVEQECRT